VVDARNANVRKTKMVSKLKAAVLATSILVSGCAAPENLTRLSSVATLFNDANIVQNFSNMRASFNAVDIAAAPSVSALPQGQRLSFNAGFDEWRTARDTTAIVVLRDGQIVFEDYFLGTSQDDHRISWSVAKSYLSALFGVLIARGDIQSIEDQVTLYAPELVGSAYEGASIRNVLQMSSGVVFNENYNSYFSDINRMGRLLATGGSMDEFAAGIDRRFAQPGDEWRYVSIDTHVLSMVLRNATGRSLPDLMSEYILQPLDVASGAYYLTDGVGVAFALGGLNLTTRDYARFGEMMRLNGSFQGVNIVPADWVVESTVASANTPQGAFQYGYQWWIPPNAREGEFFAMGVYGQFIYVDRTNNVVVAVNAADRDFLERGVLEGNIAAFRAISDNARRSEP
jgi:CubicO group peptidase (beta-lactamase class C family)